MAIPTVWYVRTGGSDLNSGGTDADNPVINGDAGTPFVIAGGTGLTYAPGGLTGQGGAGINLQIAAVSTIRGITIVSDTTATLDAAVADGSYNGRIGGARTSIKKTVMGGAGENAKWASGHLCVVNAGNYTENSITPVNGTGTILGVGSVVVDGTGGAAGSDIFASPNTAGFRFINLVLANPVDRGITLTQYYSAFRVRVQAPGGIGFQTGGNTSTLTAGLVHCSVRAGATHGYQPFAQNEWVPMVRCEAGDCGGAGINAGGALRLHGCAFYDNASDGVVAAPSVAATVVVEGCTFEGNGGDGLDLTVTNVVAGYVINNVFSNNASAYGVRCNAQITNAVHADYNNYSGNATAPSTNFLSGTNDTAVDPGYVNAGGDDYTLDTGSAMIATGYSPFKSPMKVNVGATIAEVAAAGSALPGNLSGGIFQ